ncbi:MAG: MotA/TolQ/ExbB proton channel family protein [Bacteroidales bacterium]|jgi:biopolymer transport protein ExbB|nr:MotA/TolQ/ExbB proton channel family protein [Bacteroidales bacterium]
MKKIFVLFSLVAFICFATTPFVAFAEEAEKSETEKLEQEYEAGYALGFDETLESQSFHQVLKEKFIEGGAAWMAPILVLLIFGLALVIERVLYLTMSTTNTEHLLKNVESALQTGGVEAAKELCKNTRGPVATIFYQGLDHIGDGIEGVEKSIVSLGAISTARLEKNMSWISFIIAVSPMVGFLGTAVGMVMAFDAIEIAGDISPTVVAGGMKVALLTTVFALIVAIIIQFFYNYLAGKIESLVDDMENASIDFIDLMVKHIRNQK